MDRDDRRRVARKRTALDALREERAHVEIERLVLVALVARGAAALDPAIRATRARLEERVRAGPREIRRELRDERLDRRQLQRIRLDLVRLVGAARAVLRIDVERDRLRDRLREI